MPFQSRSQIGACFAKKAAGTAGSWNCDQWASETPSITALPQKKKKMRFGGVVFGEKETAPKRMPRLHRAKFGGVYGAMEQQPKPKSKVRFGA